jgi:Ca-activated chloride channel family protein
MKPNERQTPEPAASKDRNATSVAAQATGAPAEMSRIAETEQAKSEEYKAKADAMLAAAVSAPEGQKKQPANVPAGELSEKRKSLPEALTATAPTSSAQPPPPGQNDSSHIPVKGLAAGVAGSLMSSVDGASASEWMPPRPRRRPWDGPPPILRQRGSFNTETYDYISDNPFLEVAQNPLSTFSIDVDTASYSNVRRFLESGKLPPKDAVRIEELVNYFDYDYKGPKDEKPFAVDFELTEAPWKPEHKLLRIGLKGREISPGKRPLGNLVFLLDVSGSMADENKLPLVKESMRLLVDQLTESDRVAIVVYAGDTSLVLPSTSGDQKEKIRRAIDRLQAGGSTNGASGIQLAYRTARENFTKAGTNRVILATDGDFNVGITNRGDLTRLIEDQAKSGIYLSALGFGMGNYKDATLELLADKGRGNYAYIDTLREAKKVLVEQMNATLITIARDVKIQVEFNPRRVSSYRLIGYEDRMMPKEDFNDDARTAGAVGAGHTVTALYELVPAGMAATAPGVDPLKYQKPVQPSASADSNEILTVKIRSKEPEKDQSVLSEFAVKDSAQKFSRASQDFKFAAAVAAFGMVLRDSPHKGSANLESVLEWAKEGRGPDSQGYRQEFIRLVHRAISISF